jgi:hypothetical protein
MEAGRKRTGRRRLGWVERNLGGRRLLVSTLLRQRGPCAKSGSGLRPLAPGHAPCHRQRRLRPRRVFERFAAAPRNRLARGLRTGLATRDDGRADEVSGPSIAACVSGCAKGSVVPASSAAVRAPWAACQMAAYCQTTLEPARQLIGGRDQASLALTALLQASFRSARGTHATVPPSHARDQHPP